MHPNKDILDESMKAVLIRFALVCRPSRLFIEDIYFLYPPTQKVAGYYVIPSEPFECLSVSASFPDSNLSSFGPIFFKLCMDITMREEWFRIANGLNSLINNRVMALD